MPSSTGSTLARRVAGEGCFRLWSALVFRIVIDFTNLCPNTGFGLPVLPPKISKLKRG